MEQMKLFQQTKCLPKFLVIYITYQLPCVVWLIMIIPSIFFFQPSLLVLLTRACWLIIFCHFKKQK